MSWVLTYILKNLVDVIKLNRFSDIVGLCNRTASFVELFRDHINEKFTQLYHAKLALFY